MKQALLAVGLSLCYSLCSAQVSAVPIDVKGNQAIVQQLEQQVADCGLLLKTKLISESVGSWEILSITHLGTLDAKGNPIAIAQVTYNTGKWHGLNGTCTASEDGPISGRVDLDTGPEVWAPGANWKPEKREP